MPWLRPQFDLMGETPYDLTSASALLGDAGGVPGRGGTTPPLLLLNLVAQVVPPSVPIARRVNARSALVAQARRCADVRDRTPTLLAVDLWDRGDVVGAAKTLKARPPALRP